MKYVFSLLALCFSLESHAQRDEFKFDIDLSGESMKYSTDSVMSNVGYSSQSMNEDEIEHFANGYRKTVSYKLIAVAPHFGFRIPVVRTDVFSTGLKLGLGIGLMHSVGHAEVKETQVNYEKTYIDYDSKIGKLLIDGSANLYMRFNLEKLIYDEVYVMLYGGVRYVRAMKSGIMPVGGLEIGQNRWGVGFSVYDTQYVGYRQYSTGETEKASVFRYTCSLSIHYLMGLNR